MRRDKSKLAAGTYSKIAGIYTKEYFDDMSDSEYLDKFLSFLPEGAKILDVGSGPGQFSKYIKDRGYGVVGIDYSDEMIRIAREKVKGVQFKKMDMRNLTFPKSCFDGLLVSYSLIHIPSEDIPETLRSFNRVLKSKGVIEIIAQKGEADRIVDEPFMPTEKMFFNFFTKRRITNFLKNSGFETIFQEEIDSPDPNAASDKIIYTIARKGE